MKKIINLFPVLILIIVTVLIVSLEDKKEKEIYKNINGYNLSSFIIPENIETITHKDIDKVLNSARENNIILIKIILNKNNNSIDNYVNVNDIYHLYSKQLNLKKIDNQNSITTYKQKDSLYYPDFLNNNRYSFYSADLMKENGVYPYGLYSIYYQSESDYLKFIKEAEIILKAPRQALYSEHFSQLKEPTELFDIAIIFSVGFFSLFYFILVIFLFYRKAKEIGILILLGFSNKDILKNILKKYSLSIIISSLLLVIISILFLPNIKYHIVIRLMTTYLVIFLLSIFMSYLALLFLHKYFSLSNILKKQSIIYRISNLCLICKFIISFIMIIMTITYLPMVKEVTDMTTILKNNQILMDYAVFPIMGVENSEYDDYDKFLKFYQELKKENIDYIYVHFNDYIATDKETIDYYKEAEANGKVFRLADVDVNYLNLYDLEYFDFDNKKVNIKDIKQEFYLLPTSKKGYTDRLYNNIKKKYEQYNFTDDILIYYYHDYLFNTFDAKYGISVVASPIFRVVSTNNPFTYFENSYGLNVAGVGMNTAVKFNVANNPHFYQQKLLKIIKKVGLEKVLDEDVFVRYQDYYSDLNTKIHNANTIFLSALSISLMIYIFVLFQTFILFIDARKNEILVKSLMGFNRRNIFENVILWNIAAILFPICCIISYLIASKTNDLLMMIGVCAIFLSIDLIILLIITKNIKLTKVYTELKGG